MRNPLPSWTDGEASAAIIQFVRRVTNASSASYLPPHDRIAVLDSDGTLWCEQPAPVVAFFVMHALRDLRLSGHGELVEQHLIDAACAGDIAVFQGLDVSELADILARLDAGRTPEEFTVRAHMFLRGSLHPRFGIPFTQLTYRPMLELLAFLQAKHFRAFIVTGGSVEFVRATSEALYGVPQERVAGATVDYSFERLDGKILITRTRTLLGDSGEGEAKVRAIQQRIGSRPVLAVGNSAGDCEMLEYTGGDDHAGLCLLVQHDDPVREYEYAISAELLSAAKRSGWAVVSMRRDFRRIFTAQAQRAGPATHSRGVENSRFGPGELLV